MEDEKFYNSTAKDFNKTDEDKGLLEKIEKAYRVYKISEVFLNDVGDDYGKLKIAKLRYEFARHELLTLLEEAGGKGIKWGQIDIIKNNIHPGAL